MLQNRRDILTIASRALAVQASVGLVGGSAHGRTPGRRIKAIAFDAFTIFDILSVDAVIEAHFPGRGEALGGAWRARQFEYSWLRTLSRTYIDFWRVTEDALVFACKAAKIELTTAVRQELMNAYLALKVWPDSLAALSAMQAGGIRLAYLSNMTAAMMKANNDQAALTGLFEHALSTDAVRAFKPDPRAYQMAESAFNLPRENIMFAAFGGWDAAGAVSFGLETFWVNRLNSQPEELGVQPNAIGMTLTELANHVLA